MTRKDEREMSLIGHLSELRVRIVIVISFVTAAMILAFFFAEPALNFLTFPLTSIQKEPDREQRLRFSVEPDKTMHLDAAEIPEDLSKLAKRNFEIVFKGRDGEPDRVHVLGEPPTQGVYYKSPVDPFLMRLKVALLIGILLTLPVIIWQIWRFIKPGLTAKEEGVIGWVLSGSIFLFPIGAAFAFLMVRVILKVMQHYQVPGIEPLLDIYTYLSLLTVMMIVFGFIFMLPVFLTLAVRVGLFPPDFLSRHRSHAYVLIAVVSMFITPADPFSLFIAMIPLIILYEVSVVLARFVGVRPLEDESEEINEDPSENTAESEG
jgi:sec-independent protein translocase protein TatC